MAEVSDTEYKLDLDLQVNEQKLKLVKEIVAMANADGGTIEIGKADGGEAVGIQAARARVFDASRINDAVGPFITPDSLEIETSTHTIGDGKKVIVEIRVPRARKPPLVFSKQGNYQDEDGNQKQQFAAHSVYKRRGTKAEPARWQDYRTWIDDAVEDAQRSFLDKVGLLVRSDPDSTVKILDGERIDSPPQFLLSQSAELFEQRSEKLLSGEDLTFLWRNRSELEIDVTRAELLIQSSLRKKATLFLWLWFLEPTEIQIQEILERALDTKDRDRSDAAKSILHTAAVFAKADVYGHLVARLAESRYAHMKSSAKELNERASALESLRKSRTKDLDLLTEQSLVDEADMEVSSPAPNSRRLSAIGLELLEQQRRFL